MVRRLPRERATQEKILVPFKDRCEHCGQALWVAEHKHRTITRVDGVWKLISVIRWCNQSDCPNYHRRQHPEEEWRWALPRSKYGLDIILNIGLMHFEEGRRGSEICRNLQESGITMAQRSITHWIHCYGEAHEDEKDGWHPSDRMKAKLQHQGQVILSIEIFPLNDDSKLGLVRDCLSGEMLFVYRLHPDAEIKLLPSELKVRLRRVEKFLSRSGVPVKSLIFNEFFNEDETLISSALAIFPEIPYQLY
jgi:hypothetical protein